MKAKTELLLYRLQWLAEKPMNRGFSDIGQSFEGWAYRAGLLGQIHRLEAQGFLESVRDPASGKRLHRLTAAGSSAVLGGRDPEKASAMAWDRKWRLFLFDVPERESSKRRRLTRTLAKAGCGCLQGSVWISPAVPPEIEKIVGGDDPDCTHLLLLLADSKGPVTDARMVAGAWDFELVNERYRKLETVLEEFPAIAVRNSPDVLAEWTSAESAATRAALRIDPLLPSELLPKDYSGLAIWRKRGETLAKAARLASALGESPVKK